MHFSIPDSQQFRDDNGITYTVSIFIYLMLKILTIVTIHDLFFN